jgi:hypothetical protein
MDGYGLCTNCLGHGCTEFESVSFGFAKTIGWSDPEKPRICGLNRSGLTRVASCDRSVTIDKFIATCGLPPRELILSWKLKTERGHCSTNFSSFCSIFHLTQREHSSSSNIFFQISNFSGTQLINLKGTFCFRNFGLFSWHRQPAEGSHYDKRWSSDYARKQPQENCRNSTNHTLKTGFT